MEKDSRILCVCTNNYFRSILTEFLLKARGYTNVRSGGTASAYLDVPPSGNVLRALKRRGAKCESYYAKNIRGSDVAWAEYILCAEDSHAIDIDNTYKIHGELIVMGVPDNGVSIETEVEKAADLIVEWLEKWKQ